MNKLKLNYSKKHFNNQAVTCLLGIISCLVSIAFTSEKVETNIELININKNIVLNTYLNEYEQVLLNIINNAKDILIEKKIKNPIIKISAAQDEDYIILYIVDNGGGIFVVPKGKIFEPYFTTKHKSGGTGMGLYISKLIIQSSFKGDIKVKNVDDGVKFIVKIPKGKEF